MAWTYANWDSAATLELKVEQGRLFLAELRNATGQDVQTDSFGKRADNISQMRQETMAALKRYEDQLNAIGCKRGGLSFIQPTTVRA